MATEATSEAKETTKLTPSLDENTTSCSAKLRQCFSGCAPSAKMNVCIVAATWGFLTGVERAIILPTLWLYFFKVFSQDAAINYYGVTLAAFNCSVLIISPIYGYLAHKGIRVKALIVVSNQLEIVGNIIYILADKPWLVLIGRFVAGLGGGSEVPIYADITRLTTVDERTPYIATLLLARQFGLIVGPACTLFMENIHVKIGTVSVNVYNGPGLVMAILWALHTILVLFVYPRVNKDGSLNDNSGGSQFNIIKYFYSDPVEGDAKQETTNQMNEANDSKKMTDTQEKQKIVIASDDDKDKSKTRICTNFFSYETLKTYTKYETLTILVALFGAYFSLMSLEAVLPPVATRFFKWSEVQTSYVYLACGVTVIFVYLVVRALAQRIRDRSILIIGCGFLILSYSWITCVLAAMDEKQTTAYIALVLTGILFHVIGQPFVVCSESLYTKTLPLEDMDIGQSVLRTVLNIAILIGPFVGGSMQYTPAVVFVIMLGLIIVPTCLLCARFASFDV